MRSFDFSSWPAILSTLIGLSLFALIGIGIRLLVMFTIQQRQQRMNRQINERLKTLIAAYRTLGGSFTGTLTVSPTHLRDLRDAEGAEEDDEAGERDAPPGAERARRVRDAVEAALSDVMLLGTEEHVRLAERAARQLAAGQRVATDELVVSLRAFIRRALDLEPIPLDLEVPRQGPTRPAPAGGRAGGRSEASRAGGGGMGGGGMGGGGSGMGLGLRRDDEPQNQP